LLVAQLVQLVGMMAEMMASLLVHFTVDLMAVMMAELDLKTVELSCWLLAWLVRYVS
jgi:hypothetical protein